MQSIGRWSILVATMLLSMNSTAAVAQEWGAPPDRHCWGRFSLGSYRKVRLLTETLDGQGNVASLTTTETTTTLKEKNPHNYLLQVDVVVEVDGNQMVCESREVRQEYVTPGERRPLLGGQVQLSSNERVSVVRFSESAAPFVLERITQSRDPANPYRTIVQVTTVNQPWQVIDEVKPTWKVQTTHEAPDAKFVTDEVRCLDVPGEVVSSVTREISPAGQTLRSSTLQLLDYGYCQERSAPAWQLRGRRYR